MTFTVKLAGVPVQVDCKYAENRFFLQDYMTDEEPAFTAAAGEEEMEKTRRDLEAQAAREGDPHHCSAPWFLENNALHRLITEKLADFRVLLLHGSALCMDGRGVLFTGPSGIGKSTHTRLWREVFGDRVQMINDDKPFLRQEGDSFVVYGSPWAGKHHLSRNFSAPLHAIVLIRRGEDNRAVRMERADALQLILQQGYRPENPAAALKVLALQQQLAERVPVYALFCNMEPEAARVAYEAVMDP